MNTDMKRRPHISNVTAQPQVCYISDQFDGGKNVDSCIELPAHTVTNDSLRWT